MNEKTWGERFDEAMRQARMAAAAPELYEALEFVRDLARTGLPAGGMTPEQWAEHRLRRIASIAVRALAKARGEDGDA